MRNHLDGFRRHLEARRSPRTGRAYVANATAFLDALGAEAPTIRTIEAFLDRARKDGGQRAASTRNQELAALRAFFRYVRDRDPRTTDPTAGLEFERGAAKDPVHLDAREVRRLFLAAAEVSRPADRARNVCLVAVMVHLGLRVHEVAALDVPQADLASATLVGVRGKGGAVHDLPLNAGLVALLGRWLAERGETASEGEPALFVSRDGVRMGVRSIQRLLVRLREATGTAKRLTPHALRHTTATLALSMGVDVATVGELLRHADLNTTRRYLHLVDERRREAVRRLGTTLPEAVLFDDRASRKADDADHRIPSDASPVSHSAALDVQDRLDDGREAA